jgi:hypothetical protein
MAAPARWIDRPPLGGQTFLAQDGARHLIESWFDWKRTKLPVTRV